MNELGSVHTIQKKYSVKEVLVSMTGLIDVIDLPVD